MELPIYTTKSNVFAVLMPKFLKVLGLALLLYAGIWLNLFIMDITLPDNINYLIIAIIIVLVLIETLLTYNTAANSKYYFFPGRIEFRGKKPAGMDFRYATSISVSRNFIDNLLNTGSINIEPDFKIKSIPNCDKVYAYLQQLIQRVTHPLK